MKNILLTTILSSSLILLTACGGGSEANNNDKTPIQTKENVDYTKAETIESIYEPIANLSQQQGNIILIGTDLAESLYYGIRAGSNLRCSKGSYTKNSDKSITFNNCEFIDTVNDEGSSITRLRIITISGSISSKEILSSNSGRYETTLRNFKIKSSETGALTYNGNVVSEYSSNYAKHDITKMTFTVFDDETQQTHQLIINNYQLISNSLSITAKGNIEGNPENKIFSVNFISDIGFESQTAKNAFSPNYADITIEDTNNIRNSIKISNTINSKALIRAYADGITVTGYPKTVDWAELE